MRLWRGQARPTNRSCRGSCLLLRILRGDVELTEQTKEILGGNYEVGHKPVGRLMRAAGIAGASRRRSTKTNYRRKCPGRPGRWLPQPADFNEAVGNYRRKRSPPLLHTFLP